VATMPLVAQFLQPKQTKSPSRNIALASG
jgi:hypothetical protein